MSVLQCLHGFDDDLPGESLADADDWLRDYFDNDSAQVRGARATIDEIRSSMVTVSPPDISESLQLLRQYNSISGPAQ